MSLSSDTPIKVYTTSGMGCFIALFPLALPCLERASLYNEVMELPILGSAGKVPGGEKDPWLSSTVARAVSLPTKLLIERAGLAMDVEPGTQIISANCPNCHKIQVYLSTRWDQLRCKDCRRPFSPPLMLAAHMFKPTAFKTRPSGGS